MKGTVRDTAYRALPGARVEVIDGPQAGLSAIADSTGEFSLTGVFNETTRFRATKEGHVPNTRTLQPFCAPCNPNWWIGFTLEEVDPPVNVAGGYDMTFIADSACAALPNEFRTRTYTVTIPSPRTDHRDGRGCAVRPGLERPRGWRRRRLHLTLSRMARRADRAEQVPRVRRRGCRLIGTPAGSTITLPFDGTIDYCVTDSATGQFGDCLRSVGTTNMQCTSKHHQLILTRR